MGDVPLCGMLRHRSRCGCSLSRFRSGNKWSRAPVAVQLNASLLLLLLSFHLTHATELTLQRRRNGRYKCSSRISTACAERLTLMWRNRKTYN